MSGSSTGRRPAATSSTQPAASTTKATSAPTTASRHPMPQAPRTGQPASSPACVITTMTGTCHR